MFFLNKIIIVVKNIFFTIGVAVLVFFLGKRYSEKQEKKIKQLENIEMKNKILTYERKVEKLNRDAVSRILRQREDIH